MCFSVSPNEKFSWRNLDDHYTTLDAIQKLPWQLETYKLQRENRTKYHLEQDPYEADAEFKISITTMPSRLSSHLLMARSNGEHEPYTAHPNGTTFMFQSPQPIVLTSCSKSTDLDDDIYSFDRARKLLTHPRALYEKMVLVNRTIEKSEPRLFKKVLWTPAANDPLTLVALTPWTEEEKHLQPTWTVCTINAFWRTAKMSLVTINGLFQVQPGMPDLPQNMPKKDLKPIILRNNLSDHVTAFLTARELAVSFVDALAELLDMGGKRHDELNDAAWAKEMNIIYKGFDKSQLEGRSEITPFRIDTKIYGFGFGTRDIPTQLSVAVITAYCHIIAFYIGYIITTGHASIDWHSPTELIMFALQSKEPGDLGHVSVGIDSVDTLRRSVGVRVSTVDIQGTGETREKLELVFEDDEENEKRGLTKVVRNRAY